MRRRHSDAFVRCSVVATAPGAVDLFEKCPLFDEVRYAAWGDDASDGGQFSRVPTGAWQRPVVYLDEFERIKAAEIESLGPFVVFHPFAGTGNRAWAGKVDLVELVDALCDAGLRVVALGANSTRTHGRRRPVESVKLVEEFNYERAGLVNLVNHGSVRLQAYLATRCAAFVGAFSAYFCAAFALDLPAFVLMGAELESFTYTRHPRFGILTQRRNMKFKYFERTPKTIGRQAVEFIKAYA